MSKRLVHTPEGVRDIYGVENAHKIMVEDLLKEQFLKFGYKSIQTPTFEFFDVFSREIGTTKSNELYKFFDKEGNTLVLRPDFTPSMARCAAKYFMEEDIPVRFTYSGNTFTNLSNLQGKYKEVTQTGVEYIGDGSVYADAEVISLAAKALLKTGLKEFTISVGEIEFFKGLIEEAGLDKDTELEVRDQISNKNYFGVEEILKDKNIPSDQVDAFMQVTELFGGYECLDQAEALVNNERSKNACKRLRMLYDLLEKQGMSKYVSFDMGIVSKYNYYTGIIFKGYTYGVGDAIITGGRYDDLLSYFGKNSPAIGFMIVVDDLMVALNSQKILPKIPHNHIMVCYNESQYDNAFAIATKLREDNYEVEMQARIDGKSDEDYIKFATFNFTDEVWFVKEDGTIVKCGIEA